MSRHCVVINYTARAVNHLAAAASEAGLLDAYVRPYANRQRRFERVVRDVPGAGRLYNATFGRRLLPAGLDSSHVVEAAVGADLLSAGLRYSLGRAGNPLVHKLHWRIQKRVATVGAHYAQDAGVVASSYQVAAPAFEKTGGRKILHYPIAHHRFIQKFAAEEAELEPEFAHMLPDWSALPGWLEPQLDRECELADVILMGSGFAREKFVEQGIPRNKLRIVPYGASPAAFSPRQDGWDADDDGVFRLLFVGHITQRKGLSYLLRAYRAFRGPGTRLSLVGNFNGDKERLSAYLDLFTHIPHVSQSALAGLYRQADVFVFPSLFEGLGLVVLEAMASGLPVITTPNGPGDVVRDGIDGFVVPIRDVDAIVDKLEYLRANPRARREMGINARQRALEYTWAAYRQRTTALIAEMLDIPALADSTVGQA